MTRVALVAILLLALLHLAPFLGYLTDDTFIHLQFAKNLVAGHGFAFNAGEPTYGATSPPWVLLLAATGAMIPGGAAVPDNVATVPPLAWAAKAWGAIFLLMTVVVLVRAARVLGWGRGAALAGGALLALHAWSARWAISGMETPLAVLLAAASWGALARVLLEGRGSFVAGLVLGLAALARPECWLLLGIGLVAIALGARERRGRDVLLAAGGAGAVMLPWLATAWAWFHRLLPNTSAAKAGAVGDPELAASALAASVRSFLSADALLLALLVIALALGGPALRRELPHGRRVLWLAVLCWPVALVAGLAAGGVQVVSRYLLPALPSTILLGVASMRWATARLVPRRQGLAWAVLLVLFAGQNLVLTLRFSAPHARRHTPGLLQSLGALGLWARAATPPETRFALPDIGAFGYYSDRPVLDLFGLVTPAMAPIAVREGYDAVVMNVLFESVGRPEYLIDRAREPGRLTRGADPTSPYRFVLARSIPDLGITRPGAFVYSVYAIDWSLYDRMHPRLASGGATGHHIAVAALEFEARTRYDENCLKTGSGPSGGGGNAIASRAFPTPSYSPFEVGCGLMGRRFCLRRSRVPHVGATRPGAPGGT